MRFSPKKKKKANTDTDTDTDAVFFNTIQTNTKWEKIYG